LGFPAHIHVKAREREREREREKNFFSRNTMELLGPSHTILVWGIVCPSLFVCQMRKKRREKEKKVESLGVRLSTFVSFYPHTHTKKREEEGKC
jgi:hypothetical protein